MNLVIVKSRFSFFYSPEKSLIASFRIVANHVWVRRTNSRVPLHSNSISMLFVVPVLASPIDVTEKLFFAIFGQKDADDFMTSLQRKLQPLWTIYLFKVRPWNSKKNQKSIFFPFLSIYSFKKIFWPLIFASHTKDWRIY